MSGLIYKKMSEVMKDIGAITKDQKNSAQGFKFRGIDQFVNALYPALTKHGVFMTPRCSKEEHELKEVIRSSGKSGIDKHVTIMMEYDFFAEDGSKITVGPVPAEGLDSGDKATNKALSAALKYALIQTFSVPTEDMAEADLDSPTINSPVISETKSTGSSFTQKAKEMQESTAAKTLGFTQASKQLMDSTVKNIANGLNDDLKVTETTAPAKKSGWSSRSKSTSSQATTTKGDLY